MRVLRTSSSLALHSASAHCRVVTFAQGGYHRHLEWPRALWVPQKASSAQCSGSEGSQTRMHTQSGS